MKSEDLMKILANHSNWLNGKGSGSKANLACANLTGANLAGADLTSANLTGADLTDADLTDVKTNDATYGFWLACPETGSFIAFKKAHNKIVVLEIPADARRSSATSLKCRCDKAKVLRIENLDGSLSSLSEIASDFDCNFVYKVGEIVSVDDFDTNRWAECSAGIHFFISRQLAVNYIR